MNTMPTVEEIEHPAYRISSIAVDNVIFVDIQDPQLFDGWHDEYPKKRGPNPTEPGIYVMTIERLNPPFQGEQCLPGGFVNYGEDPKDAAPRELKEETHLSSSSLPKQVLVGVYGYKNRDPRRHVISIAYGCVLDQHLARVARGGDDARTVSMTPLKDVLSGATKLGFDHVQIVTDASDRILKS